MRRTSTIAAVSSFAVAAMAVAGTVSPTTGLSGAAATNGIIVVSAVSPTPTSTPTTSAKLTPLPTPTPTPSATPPAAVTMRTKKLEPLYLADMKLWNWNGTWHASEWAHSNSQIGWKYDHIIKAENGNTRFRLDAKGAPELQAMTGTWANTRGIWETEVTLPELRDGLIVAPLWLYDPASRDEIDFEYAGRKGLDVTVHGTVNGQTKVSTTRLFTGRDMSGERHRFGIKVDQAFGYIEMYFDGVQVKRWDKATTPFLAAHPLKPWISMWAANPANGGFVSWAGKWNGIGPKDALVMVAHGYGYSSIQ